MKPSTVLRRINRNPSRARELDAPALVRTLREAVRLQAVHRLTGTERASGFEPAIMALRAAAAARGVVWDLSNEAMLERIRNDEQGGE